MSTVRLPSHGWVSTNGSTIPYTFSATIGNGGLTNAGTPLGTTTDHKDSRLSSASSASSTGRTAIEGGSSGSTPTSSPGDSLATASASHDSITASSESPTSTQTASPLENYELVFTIGLHTITAYEPKGTNTAIVDGTTISVGGPPITMYSRIVSLGPSGIVVVGNRQTRTLFFTGTQPASLSYPTTPPATDARTTTWAAVPQEVVTVNG